MSLPSPPRCILNRGHSVHPCFHCFFNLELKPSVHQTLGSISLWSSAYSNHFQTCCAGICFSGWVVRAQMQKKKKKNKTQHPKKSTKPIYTRSGSTGERLICSSTVHLKRKARKWKLSSVWSPYWLEPTMLGRNLTPSVLDLLFRFLDF